MKHTKSYLFLVLPLLQLQIAKAQPNSSDNGMPLFEIEKIILGDINNDKIIDTAYIKTPKFLSDDQWGDCKNGACEVDVNFSTGFPAIHFGSAVSATVENIGDIDGDGKSEIVAVPGWIIGCWGQIRFFSMKNGDWKEIGRAKRNICNDEKISNCIKKIKGKNITVIEELWVDGDVVEKAKIIAVK